MGLAARAAILKMRKSALQCKFELTHAKIRTRTYEFVTFENSQNKCYQADADWNADAKICGIIQKYMEECIFKQKSASKSQ